MPEPKRRKSVHVPREVYEQLWATARLAHMPVQEVMRAALVNFAKLDHATKIGILGEFWYRGQYESEKRGQMRRLRPVFGEEAGWCGVVRARLARWRRWLAGSGGRSEDRAA